MTPAQLATHLAAALARQRYGNAAPGEVDRAWDRLKEAMER